MSGTACSRPAETKGGERPQTGPSCQRVGYLPWRGGTEGFGASSDAGDLHQRRLRVHDQQLALPHQASGGSSPEHANYSTGQYLHQAGAEIAQR